jgi:hypothetical protein
MRRMLLLACAVGLCGTVAVVAFAADSPLAERPRGPTPGAGDAREPESGPFALAAARAQSEASAERHRAAQAAYVAEHEPVRSRRSAPGVRVQLIARVADRLGVDRRSMWRAVKDVRRQISGREWSDARDEALRMLSRELDRPFAEVNAAVRVELRREFGGTR